MKLRMISILLAILIICPIGIFASSSMIDVPDNSLKYDLYNKKLGHVYDVSDKSSSPKEQIFKYSIPKDGAVVIVFFDASGESRNSRELISSLAYTKWAFDDSVNLIGVEMRQSSKSKVADYLKKYDYAGAFDHVYYNEENNYLVAWYLKMIMQDGNMDGITSFQIELAFAHVLIITEKNSVPTIRYSIPEVRSADAVTSLLSAVAEIPDDRNDLVNITLRGERKYENVFPIVDAVNEFRRENGLGTLTVSSQMTELAMQRAAECSVFYSHVRPNGYSSFTIGREDHPEIQAIFTAENIVSGHTEPADAVVRWIGSDVHKDNVLDSRFTVTGVGCYVENGHYYWVQLFGTGSGDGTTAQEGTVGVTDTVEVLESRLAEKPPLDDVTIPVCSSCEILALFANSGIERVYYYCTEVMPCPADAVDSNGNVIAHLDGNGILHGASQGVGVLEVRAYEGDPNPQTVDVTVTDHRYSDTFTVDSEPTYTAAGEKSRHCEICSERTDVTEIPRIISKIPGDVDGDGKVNSKDLLRMRKMIAGLDTIAPEYRQNADIFGDGEINAKDVLRLRMKIAGLIP